MPLLVFGGTKHDIWISSTLAAIIGMIGCYVIIVLGLKYPSQTLIQYGQQILGTWLGKILGLVYICFFILMASISARDFSELLLNYILEKTPILVFIGVLMLASVYALFAGLTAIGRFAELIVPFTLLVVIFGIIANIPNATFLPSLPLKHDLKYFINEAMLELPSFGMASSLLFLIPMLHDKAGAKRPLLISIGIVGAATIFVTIIVVAVLGPYETTSINYPFLLTFQQIVFLSSIPRFDLLFIFSWISISFLTVSVYFYIAVFSIKQLFKTKSYHQFIVPIGILILVTAIFAFPNFHYFKQILRLNRIGVIAIPLDFIIPSILLLISYFKHAHHQQSRGRLDG